MNDSEFIINHKGAAITKFQILNLQREIQSQMKKITFVEKDDNTSYDPVNTFFSKTKASSVAKPSVNSSKQTSSVKTPIEKSIQAKKQKTNYAEQAKQSAPQKIGQKGGSGYIPKKAPGMASNSYQNLREQTIYDLKQKQSESRKNEINFYEKANSSKKNFHHERKPDMFFDVPKCNYSEEADDNIQSKVIDQFESKKPEENNKNQNKLPEIKSPATKTKAHEQTNSFQKPPVPKFQSSTQKAPKATVKDKYFHKNEVEIQQNEQRNGYKGVKATEEQQSFKKVGQISKQKPGSSIQKPGSSKQISNPVPIKNQQKEDPSKISSNNINSRIKELQSYEKEYISKIQYLEQRIETLAKVQQKYNKLAKQHKLCQEKSRDLAQVNRQLAEVKQSIQKFMSQPKIPYSKKRQYLLLNQINQLKKANRQLVLRIKNYKGTDLVQMAISKNHQEINREFQIDYQQPYNQMNVQIESQISILINKVYDYLDVKSGKNKKTLKEEMNFEKEQKFLLELNSIAQKISLTYLEKYEVSPLPKCNEDCMNLYAEIQKEKANILSALKPTQITDKEDLNFAITQANLQIINDLQENYNQINFMENKIIAHLKPDQKQKPNNRPGTSYGAQNKNLAKNVVKKVSLMLQLFKKRCSISIAFHIQSVCYFTFMKEMIEKKLKKLQKELVNFYARLKQMKDIYDLGGNTAKESLYLYLQTHLQNFTLIVPNLQCDIKQIKSSYQQISKGIDRIVQIKHL